MLQSFPLLAIGLVVYAVLTLVDTVSGIGGGSAHWTQQLLVSLPLVSKGSEWEIRGGDIFLTFCMGLLFVEIIRSTQSGKGALTNNLFSVLLAVACLILFILATGFGNSVFFLFTSMTFLDALAGMIVTTVTARRDLSITDKVAGGH